MQTERNTIKFQYESLQKEVLTTADLQNQLTVRIHDLEKENIMLKNKVDETLHRGKVEVTNLRMEMLKERGDLERQRDQLKNTVEGYFLVYFLHYFFHISIKVKLMVFSMMTLDNLF